MDPTRTDDDTAPDPAASSLLDALRTAILQSRPLLGLDPVAYARGHAEFEARSDQRSLIIDHLVDVVSVREGPLSVLSVGCGDGSVDVAVADALTARDPARPVRYVGVEPFAGSADSFATKLRALDRPGLTVEVHTSTFDQAPLAERFDVITFVHSMYYVPEVAKAVRHALDLLAPGGEVIVLSAPRGALNQLADACAPSIEGHRQWFSDDVADGIDRAGVVADSIGVIDARVDLAGADGRMLDFTVQAVLTTEVRPIVLAYLQAVAVPSTAMTVPHPVDTYRIPRPD